MASKKDGTDRKPRERSSSFFNKHENDIQSLWDTISGRLRGAREKAGYTQKTFSKKIGMAEASYIKLEQGKYSENSPFLINFLANELHVSADYLVGLSENEHSEYDELAKKTGLTSDSFHSIERINNLYPNEDNSSFDYCDMINAFLSNSECFSSLIQELYPLIRELKAYYDGNPDVMVDEKAWASKISNLFYRYISIVVIPYLSGEGEDKKKISPLSFLGLPETEIPAKKKLNNNTYNGDTI